jgi:hypothetical protein
MDGTLYQKICFDLQSGCGGPKKFYSFQLHGCAKFYKNKTSSSFSLSNFVKFFMNSSLSFHVILIFFALSLFLLCAMERQASCMLSVNRTCLFHGDLFLKSIFSLALMGYVDNLYFTSVSMC